MNTELIQLFKKSRGQSLKRIMNILNHITNLETSQFTKKMALAVSKKFIQKKVIQLPQEMKYIINHKKDKSIIKENHI